MDGAQQDGGLSLAAALEGLDADVWRGRQAFVDAHAHLLNQGFQHPHLAGQGVGVGQDAALDGVGQFGQGALGRFHRIGQQAVRLADLGDLLLKGAAVGDACDDAVEGAQQTQGAQRPGHARADPQTGAPQEGAHGHAEEQIGEIQKARGYVAHRLAVGHSRMESPEYQAINVIRLERDDKYPRRNIRETQWNCSI